MNDWYDGLTPPERPKKALFLATFYFILNNFFKIDTKLIINCWKGVLGTPEDNPFDPMKRKSL